MSGGISELRDSGVMIQLAHQAMLSMGLDVGTVFQRLGVTPELLADRNARTPHAAQVIFWQVLEEVDGLGWSLGDERKTGIHLLKLR